MKKRKICVITGCRAEWGLLYPLANEFSRRSIFNLQIVATGAHLSKTYGYTFKEIEKDGFKINRKIPMLSKRNNKRSILNSINRGIAGISKALEELKPDIVFLLGDRFEIFSAACASYFMKIPIAHINGGELTEGSMDDSLRHAITKMAFLHFTSTNVYRARVIQMGEEPSRVFNVGALALDNIRKMRYLERWDFEKKIKFSLGKKNIIITFNPCTSEKKEVSKKELNNLLGVLDIHPETKIIFTMPNPDVYSETIISILSRYAHSHKKKCALFKSMGRELYLNALRFMDVVAGNSSSGIIEAPSFGIPTINIGSRQSGRLKSSTVIDTPGEISSVKKAFKKALSPGFKEFCKSVKNPYGDGNTAEKIVNILEKNKSYITRKKFFDLTKGFLKKR